jgi:hypothetical protein
MTDERISPLRRRFLSLGRNSMAESAGGVGCATFSYIGHKCGDVHEGQNFRIVACLSDGHPAPTVAD